MLLLHLDRPWFHDCGPEGNALVCLFHTLPGKEMQWALQQYLCIFFCFSSTLTEHPHFLQRKSEAEAAGEQDHQASVWAAISCPVYLFLSNCPPDRGTSIYQTGTYPRRTFLMSPDVQRYRCRYRGLQVFRVVYNCHCCCCCCCCYFLNGTFVCGWLFAYSAK